MFSYLLKRADAFPKKLPGFNLDGREKVSSVFGGILTIAMLIVMLLYAGIKLIMLVNRENPTVSTFKEEFVLSSEDKLNLKNANMRFAWTWEGYSDKKLRNDPRYVKQMVRLSGRSNGKLIETMLDYHLCTWEDFETFDPPTLDAERVLNKIMDDPERGLYCFDWDKLGETLEIWGVS